MKPYLLISLVAVGIACEEQRPPETVRFPVEIAPEWVTVLPDSAARHALMQCSRPVPPGDATWAATAADLDGVDTILARLLERELAARFAPGSPAALAQKGQPTVYGLQAIGLIQNGKRVLYLNGFLAASLREHQDATQWRRDPVVACDGGEGYFGAVFDPARKTISDLQFNGRG